MQQTVHRSQPAKSFAELGYVVIPWAADDGLLTLIERDLANVFHRRAKAAGLDAALPSSYDDLSNLIIALKQHDQSAYLQAAKTANHLASLSQLCVSPEVMALVRDLGLLTPTIATRTVLHFMANSLAIEGGYLKTPPHQDFRSVQGSLNSIVLWTPLADVGLDDYPVIVADGSHRLGLLPSTEHVFGHQIEPARLEGLDFHPVKLKRGEVLVFSTLLVHATSETGSTRVRIAASFRFNDAADSSYIERGLPIPYIYKADMALRTPDFPTPAHMDAIFGRRLL
jgi:ectoine hydroxylase-related dioxygenase (phytanoyl-CoA dioxygenase family)